MRELRPAGAQAARRRAGDLRLRALPAAPARRALGRGCGGELREPTGAVGLDELLVAADALPVDDDLGERHHAGEAHQLRATLGVLGEVDLLVGDAALGQEGLGDRGNSRRARSCRR